MQAQNGYTTIIFVHRNGQFELQKKMQEIPKTILNLTCRRQLTPQWQKKKKKKSDSRTETVHKNTT